MEIEIALSGTAVLEGKKKKKERKPNWISRDLGLSFLTLPSDLGETTLSGLVWGGSFLNP